MGSSVCGHFDLHFFDTKKLVFEWRTGSANGASKPRCHNRGIGPEVVGNEADKGQIEQRVKALTGRTNFEVLEVRRILDAEGRTRSFEVDIR